MVTPFRLVLPVSLVLLSSNYSVHRGLESAGAWVSIGLEAIGIGDSRLIAYEPLPDPAGLCVFDPPAAAAAQSASSAAAPDGSAAGVRPPIRTIRDTYPALSAVAVDPKHDEVVVTDENLFQILVYDRKANTPTNATLTEPRRLIAGSNTQIEFQCGLYIDPENGDIYAVNSDTVDKLVIFSRKASGNAKPARELKTPHGTFGIAVDEKKRELFLTIQHDSAVVVYDKHASGGTAPIRLLQGNRTQLADPHGIALDAEKGLIFVTNYGSTQDVSPELGPPNKLRPNWPLRDEFTVPGSGRFLEPSITVHASNAAGNTAPIRVIAGPRTQLNWPTGIAWHPKRNEIFVTNDTTHSILVFDASASGNVAPLRVLKGPRTHIRNPTGVFLDLTNDELWVANFGGHSTTVYSMDASGDVPPLRRIRSAPEETPSLMIGNPGAIDFDTKRGEILVPN